MSDNYITYNYENGSINISEDVVAVMVAATISEVEGVAGLANTAGSELSDFLGKKTISKGVKVQFTDNKIMVDVLVTVRYGYNLTSVGEKVQEAVAGAVEATSGMCAPIVNVHIAGVSFDKN